MLHITQAERDGTLMISLSGELDHHAARAAIEQAEDLLVLYPCEKLILNLSGLTFMDSSGSGYEFIVRGAPPQPMRVFEAAGLPQVMIFERGE